ncbi:aldehyde dehydrogenase family protein [Thermoflexus sp.]|uniref:aldehyde dehydrogenase family protein n=1 Tax=Thermoflexus sp. TaxID=1969742 RepID=UPI0025DDCD88|nr:aldehyde dehydrogenase family protein [Thermoflexus sp.]MDW8179631.1 aldehyde dehydrogenase family protein [Anaerolineae bacterium]MCS6963144.1 aldehyde dehydrogenase family protein [Thermoflexus sp.]MCS7350182.1 aldehyde dehydrogenase family protein [Thermoflexus sp.]MCX7689547.1 aldehyde dehydrogenase family protein [Thermoflexus sp.]MDW8185843.1 aldehyde dehydrogenase family protein [Anaerolineae bacterium]
MPAKKKAVKKAAKKAAPKKAARPTTRKAPARAAPRRKVVPTAEAPAPPLKITYATLAVPSEELHIRYEVALGKVRESLGGTIPIVIGGQPRYTERTFEDRSPIHTDWLLGVFQRGTPQDVSDAVAAAKAVFPAWSRLPWTERVKILRRAADLISERAFEIAALMSLEVGKNRLEALGDVEETADLIRYYCDQMEAHDGYIQPMKQESPKHHNRSVLKPYGVWAVISPFNFPFALAGGPSGAALLAGNTVVFKPASDTPYVGYKLYEIFRDAGVPDGAFNYITGSGSEVGDPLVLHPDVAGITFTGSYEVGMSIYRKVAASTKYPKPIILEMGGKNPVIISRHADLDRAALGCMRSAFGLQGQKCSAASRIYVERPVRDAFLEKFLDLTSKIRIGDPTQRDVFLGPVINRTAYEKFQRYMEILRRDGVVLFGGNVLTDGEFAKGYFVEPTVVDGLPPDHPLLQEEMFLPITCLVTVDSLEEAMRYANAVDYGLTAGFYSNDPQEIQWFFDHIEAGVTYVNRAAGATTGAWPGYQPFGGWKASGSTGRGSGGPYYLIQYLREQSQTVID